MAGGIAERQLTRPRAGNVRFVVAMDEHDAELRRLLRASPMRGSIRLSLEREPDYFRGANVAGADDATIIGFDHNRVTGMGTCSVSERFINGEARRVGYLGGLRLAPEFEGRFDIIRRGYRFFEELAQNDPADCYFTSIIADNERALRFLERNVRGMPAYERLGKFSTFVLPVLSSPRGLGLRQTSGVLGGHVTHRKAAEGCRSPRRWRAGQFSKLRCVPGTEIGLSALVRCLNAHGVHFQFATVWTEERLRSLQDFGCGLDDFVAILDHGEPIACAAVWDQRSFKQAVIRGYSRSLGLARPFINFANTLIGRPRLPRAGTVLAQGFVSPFACADPRLLPLLLKPCQALAAHCGLQFLTLGFASNDPRAEIIRRDFNLIEFRSCLYSVRWPRLERGPATLDGRMNCPEVALL